MELENKDVVNAKYGALRAIGLKPGMSCEVLNELNEFS